MICIMFAVEQHTLAGEGAVKLLVACEVPSFYFASTYHLHSGRAL